MTDLEPPPPWAVVDEQGDVIDRHDTFDAARAVVFEYEDTSELFVRFLPVSRRDWLLYVAREKAREEAP